MGLIDQMMANLYKPPKQEKAPQVLPKHLTPAKIANMTAQTTVTQGQLLRGEVMDLRANQIMVLLENGATVTARTDGTLELSIGQNAQFLVAQTTEEQILLKHVKEQDVAENPMIDKALTAANITKTERSVSIVTELLAHQQPVNEGNIRHYLSLSTKYPELPVKDLILMELHHIPVTKESVEQFASYHNRNSKLLTQAQDMIKELTDTMQKLPEGEIKQNFLKELNTLLVSSIAGRPAETVPTETSAVKSVISIETTPNDPLPLTPNTTNTQAPIISDAPVAPALETPSTPEPGIILPNTPALTSEPETAPVPVDSATVPPPLREPILLEPILQNLTESFLLKPEEIAEPEKVQQYYEELNAKLEQLEQLSIKLSEAAKDNASNTPKQMRSNVSFMEAVNQVFPYLQLPLKFRESPAHGELYVYEKKRSLKPSDSLSALLHLELENLGTTDIFVTLAGTHVTTRFSMTDQEAGELVRRELPSLTTALSAKGYTLQSEVTVREPEEADGVPTLLEQFLEEHAPGGLNRYTFDIRA